MGPLLNKRLPLCSIRGLSGGRKMYGSDHLKKQAVKADERSIVMIF